MHPDTRAALEQHADAADPEALSGWLYPLIEDDHEDLVDIAAWLGERGMGRPLLWLMDHLIIRCDHRVVDAIRATLPATGPTLAALLREDLSHDAPEERRAAALFAGLLRLDALAPRLIEALVDPYFLTRMEAARALGLLRHAPAVPELRASLRDTDILVRDAAIEALTLIPDPELLTAYTGEFIEDDSGPAYAYGAFDQPEARARASAIRLLLRHRPPCALGALDELIRRLEDHFAECEAEGEEIDAGEQETLRLAQDARQTLLSAAAAAADRP